MAVRRGLWISVLLLAGGCPEFPEYLLHPDRGADSRRDVAVDQRGADSSTDRARDRDAVPGRDVRDASKPDRSDASKLDASKPIDSKPKDQLVLVDTGPGTTFVLATSSASTGTNCAAATTRQDLVSAPFTPPGPAAFVNRNSGPVAFCSSTFSKSATLDAGTTTLTYFAEKTGAGDTCTITFELLRNGTQSLGTGSVTLPGGAIPVTQMQAQLATAAASLAPGDRLNLLLTWEPVKACIYAHVHYGGPAVPSSLRVPPVH